ncbi:MAG: hypothetical protein GY847_39535 [Proteobacteria bacterium]|nr:hypothetical protein [Pseudomonadota bacterium]
MRIIYLVLSFTLSSLIGVVEVAAEDSDKNQDTNEKSKKQAATEYFKLGENLFEMGKYRKAAEMFLQAYDASPHPMVLANIGLSYDKAGKVPEAVEVYRKYMSEVGQLNDDGETSSRLVKLEKQIADLHLDCTIEPCTIKVDGVEKGEAPLSVVVYPGLHRVEAESKGQATDVVQILIGAGKHEKIVMGFGKPDVDEPETQEASLEETDTIQPKFGLPFWISLGTSGAAGIVTIVFGAITLNNRYQFDDSDKLDESIKEQGERNRLITNVMLGVTAASILTAAGFAIYDLWPKQKENHGKLVLIPGPGLGLGASLKF